MSVDDVLRAADMLVGEAQRRARGEPADSRLDVPLAMLRDVADDVSLRAMPPGPRDLDVPIRPKRPAPPAGSSWCVEHQTYDLCGGRGDGQ